jgi:hypothetical protein
LRERVELESAAGEVECEKKVREDVAADEAVLGAHALRSSAEDLNVAVLKFEAADPDALDLGDEGVDGALVADARDLGGALGFEVEGVGCSFGEKETAGAGVDLQTALFAIERDLESPIGAGLGPVLDGTEGDGGAGDGVGEVAAGRGRLEEPLFLSREGVDLVGREKRGVAEQRGDLGESRGGGWRRSQASSICGSMGSSLRASVSSRSAEA